MDGRLLDSRGQHHPRGTSSGVPRPGASLAIGRRGRLVRLRGYGTTDLRPGFGAVTDSTLYDLASITKVMATTAALMMLVDDGVLGLDDPVRQAHTRMARHAGEGVGHAPQPAAPQCRARGVQPALARAQGPRPVPPPDRRHVARVRAWRATVYSDFGIILLGLIIEQVSGRTLDVFLRDRLFGPLGMRDTGFNPLQWPYSTMWLDRTANPCARRRNPSCPDRAHGSGYRLPHAPRPRPGPRRECLRHGRRRRPCRTLLLRTRHGRVRPAHAEPRLLRAAAGSSTRPPSTCSRCGPTPAAAAPWAGTLLPRGTRRAVQPRVLRPYRLHRHQYLDRSRADLFVVLLTNRVNPSRDNQRHIPLRGTSPPPSSAPSRTGSDPTPARRSTRMDAATTATYPTCALVPRG
jgi:CubicO group peptidase (beta-lactamase class C family)